MPSTIDLFQVKFGEDDAESEEKQGFLDKVFLKTPFYTRATKRSQVLVTGRKGIGKTATCLALKRALEKEDKITIFITPKLLPVPKMQEIKEGTVNDKEKFELIWKYVLLIEIAQKIIDTTKEKKIKLDKYQKEILGKIRQELVKDNQLEKNIWEKFINALNIFSKLTAKVGMFEAVFESQTLKKQNDASDLLDKFEEKIIKILEELDTIKIVIFVDQVDDIWNWDKESRELIIGLINSIRKLSSELVQTNLFLRSDIWDFLSFHDKDKFRSIEERLNWSNIDLKQLITSRIKISANIWQNNIDEIWNTIFVKQVNKQDSFDYIVERTLKRPRDLIQFCNLALKVAQDNEHKKITELDILQAETRYSEWKLDDLSNEFSVQYPFLKDIFSMFIGFNKSFTKEEFYCRFEQSKQILMDKHKQLAVIDFDAILQILYNLGFVGGRIKSQKNEDIFYYDAIPGKPTIVLANVQNLQAIVVHPAFHYSLGFEPEFSVNRIQKTISQYGKYNINIGNVRNITIGDIVDSALNHYAPKQKQSLAEAAAEIQQLLEQLSQTYSAAEAEHKVAEDLAEKAKQDPSFKENLKDWSQSLLEKDSETAVVETVKEGVKRVIPLAMSMLI